MSAVEMEKEGGFAGVALRIAGDVSIVYRK